MKWISRLEARKSKITLFFTVVFFSFVNFYSFFIFPLQEKISLLKEQQKVEKQHLEKLQEYSLSHPNIDQYLLELDKTLNHLDDLLPNDIIIHQFITQLEQSSQKSGIHLLHIKPGQVINKNQYREIPIEIIARGDYFHTLEFLKNIENNKRFLRITKISIYSRTSFLETNMTVNIYSFGAPPPTTIQPEVK